MTKADKQLFVEAVQVLPVMYGVTNVFKKNVLSLWWKSEGVIGGERGGYEAAVSWSYDHEEVMNQEETDENTADEMSKKSWINSSTAPP